MRSKEDCYAFSETLGCRLENFGGKCECVAARAATLGELVMKDGIKAEIAARLRLKVENLKSNEERIAATPPTQVDMIEGYKTNIRGLKRDIALCGAAQEKLHTSPALEYLLDIVLEKIAAIEERLDNARISM